jgi:hypothetical protein
LIACSIDTSFGIYWNDPANPFPFGQPDGRGANTANALSLYNEPSLKSDGLLEVRNMLPASVPLLRIPPTRAGVASQVASGRPLVVPRAAPAYTVKPEIAAEECGVIFESAYFFNL